MKTNLFKPQYTILQNVLYDKNDVDCFFVPTSLWQFLCSSHFLCPWNVYISFISFKCLIFFLGFNVDLISNDDSSGPCRHISGPNRPRDLQSINSREPRLVKKSLNFKSISRQHNRHGWFLNEVSNICDF